MARLTYNNRAAVPKPTTAAVCTEQVQRFVLLAHILKAAGLTPGEVKTCMAKYVAGLSPEKSSFLLFSLPKVEQINSIGSVSDMAIANLSDGNMTVEEVTRAAQHAKLSFVESPELGHGEKGWLRELLHALAGQAKQGAESEARAWFNNPDCAIWLAIMARVQLVLSVKEWGSELPVSVRNAYRDGWLGVFGVQREVSPFSAPVPATSGWSGVIKAKSPKKKGPKAAAVAATNRSSLTREFFASQTENPVYLSLIKEIPAVVKKSANELRQQLGLPQIALQRPQPRNTKTQAGNSKAQKKPRTQKPQVQPKGQTGNSEPQAEGIKLDSSWPALAGKQ
jgi:hypothetical protein